MSLSDQNSDSEGSSDSQSEIDEADRAQQEENKQPVSAASYHSSSPTKKDRVRFSTISTLFYGGFRKVLLQNLSDINITQFTIFRTFYNLKLCFLSIYEHSKPEQC